MSRELANALAEAALSLELFLREIRDAGQINSAVIRLACSAEEDLAELRKAINAEPRTEP